MPHSKIENRKSKMGNGLAHYFISRGWTHLLLLAGVGIFLFPFLWMLSTSLKTDEEVTNSKILPEIPTFRPTSPYVPDIALPQRLLDIPPNKWDALLPQLLTLAGRKIAATQSPTTQPATIASFENRKSKIGNPHSSSSARLLVSRTIAKLNRNLWLGPDASLLDSFQSFLTPEAIASALSDSLARLDLLKLQLRTLDASVFNLADSPQIARDFKIESGPGELISIDGTTRLAYHFNSASDPPVILSYSFRFPKTYRFKDLHKLILSILPDNSWHTIDATLDVEGQRWTTQRPTYLAMHRSTSILLQPPTFDDTTNRAKLWIPLRLDDRAQITPNPDPASATLRLILSPRSTAGAIYGKAERNYLRAFLSGPFWMYLLNSVILVALCVAGACFSASFVAYAFARLHWPGRSLAFVIILATMMLPAQVTMIPSFLIWRYVGWYNTLNPLWVPSWFGIAFFIFLMTQQMRTIPRELEEAAKIDGLNSIQTWFYIILPQVKPALAAIAILAFQGAWNDFMGPLVYIRDQSKFPLSLGLFSLRIDPNYIADWSMIMAGNMLMTVPVIIIFFLAQRYFIQGLTMSGMKG
ncbi:MAG: ABC transporter permease subunit [Planctomycetota bacterium]|nr:ABC transporter permease subunit [Planctomycetota bacterium]